MDADKHKVTEFSMNEYETFQSAESNDECINQKNYQHAIENIMYAAIHIRSNIAFAIEKFNQYFNDFAKHHEQTFKHFLRYIRFIINKNITYENNENHKFVKYFHFDYVVDKLHRKFVLTYVYMIVENSFFWLNRKQKFVTTFIIEIEYMTLSICVKKNMWLIQFFKNMKYNKYFENEKNEINVMKNIKHSTISIQLKKNNKITNHLMKNVHMHKRFKHIDVIYHHVQNLIKKNFIRLNYTFSVEIMIDKLTKLLIKNRFKCFVSQFEFDASFTKWWISENWLIKWYQTTSSENVENNNVLMKIVSKSIDKNLQY